MDFEAESEAIPLTPEQEAELRALAVKGAPDALFKLDAATEERDVFHALPDATAAAFDLGKFDLARELAEWTLSLAAGHESNWGYGNAVHAAHTVLGLLALQSGDIEEAQARLAKSGSTPGSPQLDTFGPSMMLARELLRHGRTEPVLAYLNQCRGFWEHGVVWLDLWQEKISRGELPNCFSHGFRVM